MEGWISLHRKIQGHWLFKKSKVKSHFEAWLIMLLEVNHTEKKVLIGNEVIVCKSGESLNSLDTWSRLFGWDKSKTRRFLKLLESDSMIELKPTHKTTHLTICKYDTYQGERNTNETQMKRKRNVNETQMTPNNNDNNDNNDNNGNNIEKRAKLFGKGLNDYKEKYPVKMLKDFYLYWTEPNKSKSRLRFEMQKTWDLKLRLIRWADNNK